MAGPAARLRPDAASAVAMLAGAGVAVVDPPRKGLEAAVVAGLRSAKPRRILYVSCDPESLTRDAALLGEGGVFRLGRLTPCALFPYTDHVETLAGFSGA